MIVILSEVPKRTSTVNVRETEAITQAAHMFGCRVFHIPSDFEECETAENALAHVPEFDERLLGIWVGFIPTYERYEAIYRAALQKNIQLVNSPEQYRRAMEFDQFYPLLQGLTPKSLVIEDVSQLTQVASELGYPVFVKGAVKSNKEDGWKAVVAENDEELLLMTQRILDERGHSRGKVIVRQLVKLNIISQAPNGFPIGREFRVFLHKSEILAYGFYWDIDSQSPSRKEEADIVQLAQDVARRVDTPFLAVDIGQLENGEWIVIEVGDAQFCGLSNIPVLELWSKIKDFTL